jgi:predicted nucleic acid-binding protein
LRLLEFVSYCQVLPISDHVEAKTIELRRTTKLKLPDAIIAATALVNGIQLVTLDAKLLQAWLDQTKP